MSRLFRLCLGLIAGMFLLLQPATFAQSSGDQGFVETLRIGRGDIQHIEWHPDGAHVLVDTVRGAWLYSIDQTHNRLMDDEHIEDARLARYSPDGRFIAGVNADHQITLWDGITYEFIGALGGHESYIVSLQWQPDTNRLATLDLSGRVIFRDAEEENTIWQTQVEQADQLLWNREGTYLATADASTGSIYVWSNTGEQVFTTTFENPTPYDSMIQWRNETQLLQYNYNENPQGTLWNVETGERVDVSPIGYTNTYNRDGSRLATGGYGQALIFNTETGEVVNSAEIEQSLGVINWSPDERFIAFGEHLRVGDNVKVSLADAMTGEVLNTWRFNFSIKALSWSPDSESFLVVDYTNRIYLDGRLINIAHNEIGDLGAWRADGQAIAISSPGYSVRVWDTTTGEMIIPPLIHHQPVTQLAWQPDGFLLASAVGSWRNTGTTNVSIWDSRPDSNPHQDSLYTIPHVNPVSSIAWSPDGSTLASVETQQYIRLWQPDNPNMMRYIDVQRIIASSIIDSTRRYWELGWSPDGNLLHVSYSSSGNDGGVKIIDLTNESMLASSTPTNNASTWIWTPDNRFIWAHWEQDNRVGAPHVSPDIQLGGEGITTDDEPSMVFIGLSASVVKAIFSPDATLLIGFDESGLGVIWDVNNRQAIFHFDGITNAEWSPDGTMVALYGMDGFVRIVDVNSGDNLHVFDEHLFLISSVNRDKQYMIWSPDSQRVALLDRGVLFIYDRQIAEN